MKKGTIFKNKYASYESYHILQNVNNHSACGYHLYNISGKWQLEKSLVSLSDIKDAEHYPVVGEINIEEVLIKAILDKIKKAEKRPEKTFEDVFNEFCIGHPEFKGNIEDYRPSDIATIKVWLKDGGIIHYNHTTGEIIKER